MTKVPRHLPTGKLLPLPVPHRPWYHIGVDYVTDLPASDGYTCILVAIDRFSKACKLTPLKKLPTAFDTAELLMEHVFRNFGIPEDILSDRGPQFISIVWRAFFALMNVTVSLTSGYHPQSNRQTERKNPGCQPFSSYILPLQPEHLETILDLGGVCPKLPPTGIHRPNAIPMCFGLLASTVPLVR